MEILLEQEARPATKEFRDEFKAPQAGRSPQPSTSHWPGPGAELHRLRREGGRIRSLCWECTPESSSETRGPRRGPCEAREGPPPRALTPGPQPGTPLGSPELAGRASRGCVGWGWLGVSRGGAHTPAQGRTVSSPPPSPGTSGRGARVGVAARLPGAAWSPERAPTLRWQARRGRGGDGKGSWARTSERPARPAEPQAGGEQDEAAGPEPPHPATAAPRPRSHPGGGPATCARPSPPRSPTRGRRLQPARGAGPGRGEPFATCSCCAPPAPARAGPSSPRPRAKPGRGGGGTGAQQGAERKGYVAPARPGDRCGEVTWASRRW